TPRDETEIAQRDLERLDIYKAVAVGLGSVDTIRAADFQARGLLLSLRTGERFRVGRGIALEGVFVATQGPRSLPRALELIGRSGKSGEETGNRYLDDWANAAEGIACFCGGEFAKGAQVLWDADEGLRQNPGVTAWELNNIRMYRLLCVRYVGAFDELRQWVD